MTCKLWRDWLDPYVDDGCTPEESAGIEDHLSSCPACATGSLARLRMKGAIKAATAGRYAPSPEFRLRLEQSLQNPAQPQVRIPFLSNYFVTIPRLKLPQLTKERLQWLAAAAAVLVVGIIVWSVLLARHHARELALSQLLDLHVSTLASANPVDVASTDRHTVKPWFQGKLPFAFNLPETEGSAFKLLGGKVFYFKNSPGAQLLFELRRHQLSVFILKDRPGETPSSVGLARSRQKGFGVETWSQAGLRYVVIGDTNSADVHDLSEMLRAAGRE